MSQCGMGQYEKNVFIGEKRLSVRLTIGLVPPEVYQQRLRRKEKEDKKKGRKMSERTRLLLHFNLFVTNVPKEKLPLEKVMPLYRCRWQVELMFANWKSIFSIHTLQKMKEHRYITMLYIRIILIVVHLQIINHLQTILWKQQHRDSILSYEKALNTLSRDFSEILRVLRCSIEEATKIISEIYRTLSKNHWREKRKKRENFLDIIPLFIADTENNSYLRPDFNN